MLSRALSFGRRNWVFYLYVLPFAALIVTFGLWPIVQSIHISFTESFTALSPDPVYVGWENFRRIFGDHMFIASLRLTLGYTLVSVVANVAFALAYALLLAGPWVTWGNVFFRMAVFLPVVTPDVATYIVWKWMYNQDFGAVNAALTAVGLPEFGGIASPRTVIAALVIAELWKHAGFYAIIFFTNLKMIDPVYYEVARLEGASYSQQLRHVVLPQLRPSLTINAVYAVIQFLKTFTAAMVITRGGPNFASNFVSYYAYQKFDRAMYGEATAMATVLFAIVVGVTILMYWLSVRSDWR